VILFGHRGARGEAPENTVAGFRYARQLYLDAVEFDVRLSSDGELMVISDEIVDWTTNGRGKVSSMRASQLGALDARADFPNWPDRAGIPTLDDVLDACSGMLHLAIEVKGEDGRRLRRTCERLVATLERRWIPDHVTVTSAEASALEVLGRVAPSLARGYIAAFDEPEHLQTAVRLGCQQIDLPLRTGSADMVETAHVNGMRVTGWLGNTPEEIQTLVGWGVDAILSDFPSLAKRVLGMR
jgi:glycerophosphoryl diester phosphodiesterase